MEKLVKICVLVLASSTASVAQSDEKTPGRELAEIIFGSMEISPTSGADMGEFVSFGSDIFVSMDYDDNGSVNLEEFTTWDFGFNFIAEDEGQQRAYETAQKIVFAVWDHDGDGDISQREYHKSMVSDFRRADTDDDAFLTRDEFLTGYVINVAYRAALTGK